MDRVETTRQFVEEQFREHPHYSFDDGSIMYNHSVTVMELAVELMNRVGADIDREVMQLACLLHDIGKVKELDDADLHHMHEDYGPDMAEPMLQIYPDDIREQVISIIMRTQDTEAECILSDADVSAFFKDDVLNMKFLEWAMREGYEMSASKKMRNFELMHYDEGRDMARGCHQTMVNNWREYLGEEKFEEVRVRFKMK